MSKFFLIALLVVAVGCSEGGDGGEDFPSSQTTAVSESCPVNVSNAASASEAEEAAEEATGGEAFDVEEVPQLNSGGLDQQTPVFRVWVKYITITNQGCGEVTVTINDNDSDDDTNVDFGGQAQ